MQQVRRVSAIYYTEEEGEVYPGKEKSSGSGTGPRWTL